MQQHQNDKYKQEAGEGGGVELAAKDFCVARKLHDDFPGGCIRMLTISVAAFSISSSPASSSSERTPWRARSRMRMAIFTRRATGPGVASQMESASTTFSRLSTLRTPFRNSMELIWAR